MSAKPTSITKCFYPMNAHGSFLLYSGTSVISIKLALKPGRVKEAEIELLYTGGTLTQQLYSTPSFTYLKELPHLQNDYIPLKKRAVHQGFACECY